MNCSINKNDKLIAVKNLNTIMSQKQVLVICTHDGQFHADEVFAMALLEMAYPRLNYKLVRTRDEEVIKTADIVLDVGGEYCVESLRFDHHQKEGVPRYSFLNNGEEMTPKMATCGICLKLFHNKNICSDEALPHLINWLSQVDFTDNGDVKYLGESKATTMMAIIGMYNDEEVNSSRQDACFYEAMQLAKSIIRKKVKSLETKIKFETKVFASLEDAKDGIIILQEGGPWIEAVLENTDIFKDIMLCIFEAKPGDWRIQTLPGKTRFEMKCPAPQAWRGLRNKDLAEVVGISDAVFCHDAGFIGGATSKYSAIEMAKEWIALSD